MIPSYPFIIAVDGPAGAGKGTLAKAIAKEHHFAYLDTGILYRELAYQAIKAHLTPQQIEQIETLGKQVSLQDIDEHHLRSEEVANYASQIAIHPTIRQLLLDIQRKFAYAPGSGFCGAVLDGRDIGTRVCPDAPVKFFITASVEIRAERRLKELQEKGIKSIFTAVLQDLMERDARDSKRVEDPLKIAENAYVIDTSHMTPQEVFEQANRYIQSALDENGPHKTCDNLHSR